MLTKLFLTNFKDDALKWYLSLLEKSIDKYEDLILQCIANFKYNNIGLNLRIYANLSKCQGNL